MNIRQLSVRKALIFAAAAACIPNLAFSADVNGNYALRGVGSASCVDYTQALETNPAQAQVFVAWMAGYITARSRNSEETFDVLPLISGADVAGLLRVVCVQNSDASVETAIDAAIRLFEPARVSTDSPLLELEHEGREVSIRTTTLAQVQSALKDGGYYNSTVDGVFGRGTRLAIQEFQSAQGLVENGLPDADTLVALLLTE